MLWWCLPDYKIKNRSLSYWRILYSMGKFMVTEPTLVQACLIGFLSESRARVSKPLTTDR